MRFESCHGHGFHVKLSPFRFSILCVALIVI
jgi:hypothetical protein